MQWWCMVHTLGEPRSMPLLTLSNTSACCWKRLGFPGIVPGIVPGIGPPLPLAGRVVTVDKYEGPDRST